MMENESPRRELLTYAKLIQASLHADSIMIVAVIKGSMVVVDTMLEEEKECLTE